MANYVGRMQALAQRRRGSAKGDALSQGTEKRRKSVEARAGKKLIIPEGVMVLAIRENQVPTMMKHCVLAVMKKGKLGGSQKEQFLSAFNICAATFAKHGYLARRGSLRMTGHGMRRNRCHQREKVAANKKARYNGLVNKLWTPQLDQARFQSGERKREAKNARERMSRMKSRRSARK